MRIYPIQLLGSLVFTLGYFLSGAIAGTIAVLVWPLPFKTRFFIVTLWNRFVMLWLRLCCGIKFELHGARNLAVEPCVVMAKHASTWETMFLQYYFGPISTVLKRELIRIPFFGWGLATLRPIAIDRGSPIQALKQVKRVGVERIKEGTNVLIYPEGTRIAYGERGTYARSGADIATAAGVAVIPVAHNAGKFWPKASLLKKPGTVQVFIGEPIDTAERSSKEVAAEVEAWIEGKMAQMAAED